MSDAHNMVVVLARHLPAAPEPAAGGDDAEPAAHRPMLTVAAKAKGAKPATPPPAEGDSEPDRPNKRTKKGGAKHAEHAGAEELGAESSHAAETVGRPRQGGAKHVEHACAEEPAKPFAKSLSMDPVPVDLHGVCQDCWAPKEGWRQAR